MPKPTSAERLATAMTKVHSRVEGYIKSIAASNIRNAFCIINPTHINAPKLTYEQLESIKNMVLDQFQNDHLFGLAIKFFTPPFLLEEKPEGSPDHNVTVGIAEFDEGWQIDEFAKGMLYCPSERELGSWHHRYEKQMEALSLTPLLDSACRDLEARDHVRHFLSCPAKEFFEVFAQKYALTDSHIPQIDRKKGIRDLYHEIGSFPEEKSLIFQAYSQAKKLAAQTKNFKISQLMRGVLRAVELKCVEVVKAVGAPASTEEEILQSLKDDPLKSAPRYDAERRAQGLNYFRMAQVLMLFVLEFLEEQKKHAASGEIAMFVWLCQHIAFNHSSNGVKIVDLLNLKSGDFDRRKNTLLIKQAKVPLTEGLGELFSAWLGNRWRVNDRRLFTRLTFDLLSDNLKRISVKLPLFERDLLPKDLLIAPHALECDAAIDKSARKHLGWQEAFVSNSPYANASVLTKQIREMIISTLSKSNS
ncbi:MAG: hypothetical protein KF898_00595 [Parachlamydiales bacterium]|nr:hypothetical protein [Candidatus Acheromyda pituitae]